MTEAKKPDAFGAAIDLLRSHVKWLYFHRNCSPPCEGPNERPDIGEYKAAIRVLEAAAEVDKESALMCMEDVALPTKRVLDYEKAGKAIYALLEALPEPKGEPE